jgi:hypothetical protein
MKTHNHQGFTVHKSPIDLIDALPRNQRGAAFDKVCRHIQNMDALDGSDRNVIGSMAFFASEYLWRKNRHVTYFIEEDIVDLISRSTFEAEPKDVEPWHRAFALSFRKGSSRRPGLGYFDDTRNCAESVAKLASGYGSKLIVMPASCAPSEKHKAGRVANYFNGLMNVFQIYRPGEPAPDGFEDPDRDDFNFMVNLLFFIQSFPESLVRGLPGDGGRGLPPGGRNFRVELPQQFRHLGGTHASPHAHIRSFHFRALRDERFRRNPDGSIRIVPVRMTLVGSNKVEPYHIEIPQKASDLIGGRQ